HSSGMTRREGCLEGIAREFLTDFPLNRRRSPQRDRHSPFEHKGHCDTQTRSPHWGLLFLSFESSALEIHIYHTPNKSQHQNGLPSPLAQMGHTRSQE